MIDYINESLFNEDGTYKQIVIDYADGQITNSDLHYENFEIEEKLCSQESLVFGSCESGILRFRIRNPFDSLKGKELTVSEILNKDSENPFVVGKYTVDSDVPAADRSYRDVVAYDAMYKILNADVSDWYNNILPDMESKVSLREFRNAFISHFGLEEEEVNLVNDEMAVA